MAELYHPRTVTEVIPEFHSKVFDGHENSRFAVGQIAKGYNTLYPEENLAYHHLRANVYVQQTQMISEEYIASDGGEYDNDDVRSIHMAVLENCGDKQRLVGSMRLISRGEDMQLPVEKFFPDMFAENPAPASSCEVSRYIVRHEDRGAMDDISWALFQRSIAAAVTHDMGPMYAVIDESLARRMRLKRVPITELAPPTRVEEYNSTSLPVVVDIELLAQRLEARTPGILPEMIANQREFAYFGGRDSQIKIITLGQAVLGAVGE